ncbi:unnamed protein product [Toxocara canis]|uniref:U3 small nucleolar RNA-associated protein 4 homolog n=1 Tax=Toxocara canis TaxID=6265 RepID=A0A183U613_TOXCA|nr:unnamed protein product [Toxocara canis]
MAGYRRDKSGVCYGSPRAFAHWILYKLKTGRHFERNGAEARDVSHGVVAVELCLESRLLLVAGHSAQVTLFRFVKNESANEIAVSHF